MASIASRLARGLMPARSGQLSAGRLCEDLAHTLVLLDVDLAGRQAPVEDLLGRRARGDLAVLLATAPVLHQPDDEREDQPPDDDVPEDHEDPAAGVHVVMPEHRRSPPLAHRRGSGGSPRAARRSSRQRPVAGRAGAALSPPRTELLGACALCRRASCRATAAAQRTRAGRLPSRTSQWCPFACWWRPGSGRPAWTPRSLMGFASSSLVTSSAPSSPSSPCT